MRPPPEPHPLPPTALNAILHPIPSGAHHGAKGVIC